MSTSSTNTLPSKSSVHPNIPAEGLLLGNILRNSGLINEYAGTLSASDFSLDEARYFFNVLQHYYSTYGAEEVTAERFCFLAQLLEKENDLKLPPGLTLKNLANWVDIVKTPGSSHPSNCDAFRIVKRDSMLRQLENARIDVKDICEREDFSELTADQVINLVYEKLDPLANAASIHPHEDFSSNITERALRFFEKPEIGLQTPFPFINEHMHGLCPNDFTLIGGLSNTGKGRFLMNLLVWLVAKEGQSVCLLSNEMTSDDFFKAMVCTIINNPDLHDEKLHIPQSNIVQSRFKDDDGEYIERLPEENGMNFHDRVLEISTECQQYEAVLQWWEETFPGKLIYVNVANDYSTPRLKQEIRRAKANGCTVIAYDTLKGYQSTEWGELVQATTDLSEVVKSDRSGLIGLATFQLTDDVATSKPEDLTSLKIARAKGIMHLADNILMFMPLRDRLKDAYVIISPDDLDENGEPVYGEIEPNASIAAFRIVKNRRGGGKEQIYAVQTNLDLNRWVYIGNLSADVPKTSGFNSIFSNAS